MKNENGKIITWSSLKEENGIYCDLKTHSIKI